VGEDIVGVVPGRQKFDAALAVATLPVVVVTDRATCHVRYQGRVLGVHARAFLDLMHFGSAGAVSFARALNDTPKIAGLLLLGGAFASAASEKAIFGVGTAMLLGGLLGAKRVAETMARDVTAMDVEQGFSANVVTSVLVIGASAFGVPVSTTHVSVGALFGIGATTDQAQWKTIGAIAVAWVVTIPAAAILGAALAWAMS
jgi:PiT family inorganic phosphate transporter